jgi:hypothetical protein
LVTAVKVARLRWAGHIVRMQEGCKVIRVRGKSPSVRGSMGKEFVALHSAIKSVRFECQIPQA